MKKVISFVVAIALVLSMSVCAFAAEVPAADADYDAWVSYYTEVLTDENLDDDAKITTIVDNMPTSKALFYATLDKAVDDVVTDGVESDEVLNSVDTKLNEKYGWGLDEAEWEYEVEEDLDINIDGFIGNPADGNVAPSAPTESSTDLEEDENSDSSGSFLDTILGVLGGLGDILFGGGGETPEEPSDDNDDLWGEGGANPETLGAQYGAMFASGEYTEEELVAEMVSQFTSKNLTGDQIDAFVTAFKAEAGSAEGVDNVVNKFLSELDKEGIKPGSGSLVPNQGDTSVVAVATVALVAGAALVLTRKKSEDAE